MAYLFNKPYDVQVYWFYISMQKLHCCITLLFNCYVPLVDMGRTLMLNKSGKDVLDLTRRCSMAKLHSFAGEKKFLAQKEFAKKKYPLLVVIHGGPASVDNPDPAADNYVYPLMQWVEKGALVLRVNYRGSTGYGEKFRSLNVRNLGIGDMWDVMSGIQFLNSKGLIDTTRMGCMGWSQGGYISAFLTTNTNIFKAISVGAGISNWVTYYVNTDITPFTRQYLKATPWEDLEIYLKTSPMTNIHNASTPTLIQHGELDKRVPIPNAYELYRGLQDNHVPSKLIVYKGFGHGISKPKERLAATWHNWQWFNKYVFGEPEENMPVE